MAHYDLKTEELKEMAPRLRAGDTVSLTGIVYTARDAAHKKIVAAMDAGEKLPFDLAAYSFVYVAVVLSPTWLLSGARYLYALATLPILQAQSLKSRAAHAVGLSVCAALLVVFTWGYTIAAAVL